MKKRTVTLIRGDGIGAEITSAVEDIFDAARSHRLGSDGTLELRYVCTYHCITFNFTPNSEVGGQRIVSIITRRGCEEMGLEKGMKVHALFKATEVMVSRP